MRDELISDVPLWTPLHSCAKAGRLARTYIQQLCKDTGCSPGDRSEAMNDREEWRERARDIRAVGTTRWWWWWNYCYLRAIDPQSLSSIAFNKRLVWVIICCKRNLNNSVGTFLYILGLIEWIGPVWPSNRDLSVENHMISLVAGSQIAQPPRFRSQAL